MGGLVSLSFLPAAIELSQQLGSSVQRHGDRDPYSSGRGEASQLPPEQQGLQPAPVAVPPVTQDHDEESQERTAHRGGGEKATSNQPKVTQPAEIVGRNEVHQPAEIVGRNEEPKVTA